MRRSGRPSWRRWIGRRNGCRGWNGCCRSPRSLNEPESEPGWSQVEPLARTHDLTRFDCGTHPSLNEWLKRFAWTNQQNEASRTYVVHRGQRVVGYYSIASGSVAREEAPARVAKGLAHHPVPVILLA